MIGKLSHRRGWDASLPKLEEVLRSATEPMLTTKQAADKLGIRPESISQPCRDGRVPGATWVRFRSVNTWLLPARHVVSREVWQELLRSSR
jgi:hypothetical protein